MEAKATMMASSLKYRHNQRRVEMGKPAGRPLNGKTTIWSSGKLSGSSSDPASRSHAIRSDLTSAKVKLEVPNDSYHSAKKRKMNKIDINIKTEPYDEGGSTLPFQLISIRGSAPESEHNHGPHLVLMSCLYCRIHVMVSNADPKCPNCSKGDCLLDIFRGSPVKKTRVYL